MTPILVTLAITVCTLPPLTVPAIPVRTILERLDQLKVVVRSKDFPEQMQWDALSKCVRVEGNDESIGSAVVVGIREGSIYLLTANHNVSGFEARKIEFFSKATYRDPDMLKKNSYLDAVVALRGTNMDLALLKVKLDKNKPMPPVASLPRPWDRPRHFPFDALSIGCSEGRSPTCQIEKIYGKPLVKRTSEFASFFWESSTKSLEGRSGGPLFDTKGRLIGICSGRQGSRSYFTHLDEIHAWLKENQYAWLWESKVRP